MAGAKQEGSAWRFADGSEYTGGVAVKAGVVVREGEGTYVDASANTKFTGTWVNDVMEGQGRMVLPNGSVYEGGFAKNMFEGKGVLTWPNGEALTGEWSKNTPINHSVFKDERAVMWTTTCGDDITPDTVQLTPQIKLIHK